MATVQDPLVSIDSSLKELLKVNLLGSERLAGLAGRSREFQSLQATVGQQHGETLGRALGGGIGPGAALGESVGGTIGKIGGSIAGIVSPFNAATSAIGSFVKVANPGLMEKFNTVLQDVTGVIGQALAPVIEALLPAVKLFGDFLASVLPDASDFKNALEPLGGFLDDLRDALKSIAPVIKDVLVFGLKALGEALRLVLVPIRFVIGVLKGLFGDEDAKKLKDVTGSAARSIKFEDPMSAVKGVYEAAFKNVGTGPGGKSETPLDKIEGAIRDTVTWLQKIFGADTIIAQAVNWVVKIARDIFTALPKLWKEGKQFFDDVGKLGVKGTVDAIFGSGHGQDRGPDDPVKQAAFDKQARQYGKVEVTAKAVGMLPFEAARNAAGSQLLPEMLAVLRELMEKSGQGKYAERDIDELLKWAGMTSRRGIEGNSGGA